MTAVPSAKPQQPDTPAAGTALRVNCPTCRQPTRYAPDNRWRPFCSARCRGVDLGAWAHEQYRVAASPSPDEDAADDAR